MQNQMQHWLDKRAALTPDRLALIDGKEQLTFRELRERSLRTARQLSGLGIRQGAVVGLLCTSSAAFVELVHALTYLGAILMPLNTRLTAHEISFQIEDAACRHLIYDEANGQLAEEVLGRLPQLLLIQAEGLSELQEAEGSLMTYIDTETVQAIMYTSGTTGAPKGVMLTYGNHWSSAVGSVLNLGLSSTERWLAAVPLFHISGLSIIWRSVIYGMTMIIHRKFDPANANRAILEQGVTIMSVVSNMLARMLEDLGGRTYPPEFRCMLLGGGPAPRPLLESCAAKGIPVYQTYGMTETASQIVTLPPEYALSKLGSAGKPLFQAEIRIAGNRGGNALPGEAGEILVRGPNVTKGYWNRPQATAEAMKGGWLATGDIGYLDEDGFLYVLDRRKDLIISGGENVYPAEIEAALLQHPAVKEAGVTGVADERWGQVPIACVVLREDAQLSEEELREYLQDKLARYKIPARFYFVDLLPRNASGKLLRRELPALAVQTEQAAEQS